MSSEPVTAPFTVLIDSNESQPFTFQGIRADANQDHRELYVPTRHVSLGRHPHSLGDYSAEGLVEVAHVERKSMEDCQGTVLGWETPGERAKNLVGRRDRFEAELSNLSQIPYGIVIVEASWGDCLCRMPSWGSKSRELNAKIFARSVNAFMQDYPVHWLFCDSRRAAEQATYRYLERAYRKTHEAIKEETRAKEQSEDQREAA